MRFYVHYEEDSGDAFTQAMHWDDADGRSVAQLAQQFGLAFAERHPAKMRGHAIRLQRADGAPLPDGAPVVQAVLDGGDVFSSLVPKPSAPPPSAAPPAAGAGGSKETAAAAAAAVAQQLKPYLEAAEKAWKARAYRRAKEIYGELLKVQPTLLIALRRLGELELACERPEAAIPWLERAAAAAKMDAPVRLSLNEAHEAAGNLEEAVAAAQEAVKVAKEGTPTKLKAQLRLGRTLFRAGERQAGGGLVQQLLNQHMEDPLALHAYGELALELGQTEDALKVFLRLITQKSEDKAVRALLARSLKAADGVPTLLAQLPPDKSSASAYAFLATVAKEHSGVDAAVALYDHATALEPASASYALNQMHTLELKGDRAAHLRALGVLLKYCDDNAARAVGTLCCSEYAAALPPLKDVERMARMPQRGAAAATAAAAAAAAGGDGGGARALAELPDDVGGGVEGQPGAAAAGTYAGEELDLLALFFTGVKVLYCLGAVEALPPLLRLLEPARAVKDLHLTMIRNENAYYCCVAQLLASLPLPLPPRPALYFAGDSHSLAPGWRECAWRGAPHLLTPVLVTGLKAWHLRKASDFFPKYNFEAALSAVPDGAAVIFAFGEIDCREGLLVAVERAKYADLAEGIATTVEVYVSTLVRLVARRGFVAMVHPVPPVLNETRPVVKEFNAALAARVRREPTLRWLDFFDKLLTDDGERLADGLALDGTHMHPAYVNVLEEALERAD
jgi:tetratricopeptide (TPR) repeat protein